MLVPLMLVFLVAGPPTVAGPVPGRTMPVPLTPAGCAFTPGPAPRATVGTAARLIVGVAAVAGPTAALGGPAAD
jgi:hypothetical protein